MAIENRVTRMTGTEYPIIQAPMGKFNATENMAGFHEVVRGLAQRYLDAQ